MSEVDMHRFYRPFGSRPHSYITCRDVRVMTESYLSKIILDFKLQDHEYFYSGVTIVLCIGLSTL